MSDQTANPTFDDFATRLLDSLRSDVEREQQPTADASRKLTCFVLELPQSPCAYQLVLLLPR